jgi:Uma2 family endonuclease
MVSGQTIHPGEFTFEDLDALPDDGLQYELVDGMLLVTPGPFPMHQQAVVEIAFRLRLACPRELQVFVAPLDFRPTSRRSLQPDVMVVRGEDVGPKNIQRPLLLAVEVLSNSTGPKDLLLKRSLYADAGIPSYWIFDTDKARADRAAARRRQVRRGRHRAGLVGVRGRPALPRPHRARGDHQLSSARSSSRPGRSPGRTMSPVRT